MTAPPLSKLTAMKQPSHLRLSTFDAPACAFAQLAHHRSFFRSDGSPKFARLIVQSSQFLLCTFTAPGCAFLQEPHHCFIPSDGIPLMACFSPQPLHQPFVKLRCSPVST